MIGMEVCKQLSTMGHTVHMLDLGEQILRVKEAIPSKVKVFYGSILDTANLRNAMDDCDTVIHLAALLGVKRSEMEKLHCIEININGTQNVLDIAVQHGVKKIVLASSSEVYGEPLDNPIDETFTTQGKTVYAITKLAGEELCKAYSQKYNIDYSILRYFNCYGPYQVAQFVIAKFIKNVMMDRPPVVYGDGKQVRSYTYVEDTARGTVLAALSDNANGEVLNIGRGDEPISLSDLAHKTIELGGKSGLIEPEFLGGFDKSDRVQSREIFERYCDSSKARSVLGWEPRVDMTTGIKNIFECGVIFDRWENLYDEMN